MSVLSLPDRSLPPPEFRQRLRQYLIDHPGITLAAVARSLGTSRQYVSQTVGKLHRPNCTQVPRTAPKADLARQKMVELEMKVLCGETATAAASSLGLSLDAAMQVGFRVRSVRPAHGRGRTGCACWRCRRASGSVIPGGRIPDHARRALVLDWLAWQDPDGQNRLTQAEIGKLTGIRQPSVSKIAREMRNDN